MTLGEINQKTVVGLLVQELIPALDTAFPWEPGVWNMSDTHETMTHSSTKVVTKGRIYVDIRKAGRVGTPRDVGL